MSLSTIFPGRRWPLTLVTLSFAILSQLNAGVFDQGGTLEFDIPTQTPRVEGLIVAVPLKKHTGLVLINASLRFDSKGKIVCDSDCTVDGIPVTAKGKISKRGTGRWRYTISLKSGLEPKVVVKISGMTDETQAKVSYSGPKGKETIKDAPVVLTVSESPSYSRVALTAVPGSNGKFSGTGSFPVGYGDRTAVPGKLKGRLVGDFLTFTLKGKGRKIRFEGFLQGEEIYSGVLRIALPPEKGLVADHRFPELATVIPRRPQGIEKQKPFVIRFTFPLNDINGNPIGPTTETAPPTAEQFVVSENGRPIDVLETNQFLTSIKSKPLNVVLVLDYSRSMAGNREAMIDASGILIDRLSENTTLAVTGFWERQGGLGIIQGFTPLSNDDKVSLQERLTEFRPPEEGASEIWNAVDAAIDLLPEGQEGVSQAVVFLSDGHDTSSTVSPDALLLKARQRNVNIFPLGFRVRSEFPEDETNLEKLAVETGGKAIFNKGSTNSNSVLSKLRELFTLVSNRLANEWVLTYVTLRSTGSFVAHVALEDYRAADVSISAVVEVNEDLAGDIRVGALGLRRVPATSRFIYEIRADYIPRGIESFRFRLEAGDATITPALPLTNGLVDNDGWLLEGPSENNVYTLSSKTGEDLPYGSFGVLLRMEASDTSPLTVTVDNTIYANRSFEFGGESGTTSETVTP